MRVDDVFRLAVLYRPRLFVMLLLLGCVLGVRPGDIFTGEEMDQNTARQGVKLRERCFSHLSRDAHVGLFAATVLLLGAELATAVSLSFAERKSAQQKNKSSYKRA